VGATFTPDGTSNTGTLSSDFCSDDRNINDGAGAACNDADDQHTYYSWTTTQGSAQDYDIWINHQLPSDFDGFADDNSIKMYGWRTSSSDSVTYSIYRADSAHTECGTVTTVTTADGNWTQTNLGGNEQSTCSFAAGDMITIQIKLTATNGNYARAGEITMDYKSKF
jgi:hypothetical protein